MPYASISGPVQTLCGTYAELGPMQNLCRTYAELMHNLCGTQSYAELMHNLCRTKSYAEPLQNWILCRTYVKVNPMQNLCRTKSYVELMQNSPSFKGSTRRATSYKPFAEVDFSVSKPKLINHFVSQQYAQPYRMILNVLAPCKKNTQTNKQASKQTNQWTKERTNFVYQTTNVKEHVFVPKSSTRMMWSTWAKELWLTINLIVYGWVLSRKNSLTLVRWFLFLNNVWFKHHMPTQFKK